MDAKKPILVLTCLFVALSFALTACPSKEDVSPCICEESWGSTTVKCSKLDNDKLAKVARSLIGTTVVSFFIADSKFDFIPHDTFKGVKISLLYIQRSTLKALTDRGDAFVGLEDHLKTLEISKCVFENEWDWSVLRNLKKMDTLRITGDRMGTIGDDLKKLSVTSVEYLSINNNVSFVSDHAFDAFENIKLLSLSNNKITNVTRTMLPNPAWKLRWINLEHNKIKEIPKDMFTNMPNLRDINIGNNNILALNERTFSPVWELLDTFNAAGNPLRCHCGMSWIVEERNPRDFRGACSWPYQLAGKELKTLTLKELNCYV